MGLFGRDAFLSYVPHRRHFHRACPTPLAYYINTFQIGNNTNQPNIMPFESINMEEITEARRKAIAASSRIAHYLGCLTFLQRLFF